MSALPKTAPPTLAVSRSASSPRVRKHYDRVRHRNHQSSQAVEAAAVLMFNLTLIGFAVYALSNLVPYQLTQTAKLDALKNEAKQTAANIQQLEQSYERSFDPEEAIRIAEEQGHLIRADKQRIVWVKSD